MDDPKKNPPEPPLDASLRRAQDALTKGFDQQARLLGNMLLATSTQAMERVNQRLAAKIERRREREQRSLEKRRRREEQNQAPAPVGFVFAGAVAVMLYFALMNAATLWWLVFPAFGFSMAAAGILGNAYKKKPQALPAGSASSENAGASAKGSATEKQPSPRAADSAVAARLARVDNICTKLLEEFRNGPKVVREFVHRPEETLNALRKTCHDLAKREGDLRSAITEEDEKRLRGERDQLTSRVAAEKDDVVRSRLSAAVSALDNQLAQRAELGTAASRLEAESTRILYTLESLHAQVLRARTADAGSADVAGAGLRKSLDQLSAEIDSVALAIEAVNRDEARISEISPVVDVVSPAEGVGTRDSGKVKT